MGFLDKAKQMAQQVQQEAKDGTLKERARSMAEQAQQKLDEVQESFNAKQQGGGGQEQGAAAGGYDEHGRPAPVPESESTTPPAGDPLADAAGDHHESPMADAPAPAPKAPPSSGSGMTSGDPLA